MDVTTRSLFGSWGAAIAARALALAGLLIVPAGLLAQASEGAPDSDQELAWRRGLTAADGTLFVNGQFVPFPCELHVKDGELFVNDLEIACELPGARTAPRVRRPPSTNSLARRLGQQIAEHLEAGLIVAAFPQQPLVVISDNRLVYEVLKGFGQPQQPSITPVALNQQFPPGFKAEVWTNWLAGFVPPAELRRQARARVEQYDATEARARAEIAANYRLHTFSYPLSVLGMVATVLGVGHLLSHRPPVEVKSLETDTSPLALRVLTYSLVLVVVFSSLDLVWTILASQAGQMLELNPLGSRMIDQPVQLIAFKSGTTALAVGLLFALRKYRHAQLAAWWICLVCTLLTARWLTISPLFTV